MYSRIGIAKLRHFSGLPNLFDDFLQKTMDFLPEQDRLLQEDEKDGKNEAAECGEMVPLQGLSLEQEHRDERKDRQGDDFLDDFQLHEVERTTVFRKTDAVGRHLGAVLEKSDAP